MSPSAAAQWEDVNAWPPRGGGGGDLPARPSSSSPASPRSLLGQSPWALEGNF
uniref:Uncharacterized protein n=1 Tax=Aegilops tauschii TaxID=37682 RepID=M8BGL9_AEGTA